MIIRKIEVLEPQLANKIAAGEVVERPASVVKELVENSLDAGATAVTVEIRDGGTEYIRVTDNGCGIPSEDVKTAFLRHATSKLHSADGLDSIETLGFRGEALASIAAVSKVSMRTSVIDEEAGTLIELEGGKVSQCLPCGCPVGTNIEIRELFYNVPARLKFLKNPRSESAAVGDYILRLILGNTGVSFKFISNGKPVYHSAGDGSLENALICVYGADISEHIKPVSYDDGYLMITGFCGDEFIAKPNRIQQSIYVNGRYIRSQQLSFAAQRAYQTMLTVGRFPFLMLNIRISPREVDVNVHPNKLSVRFRDEERVANALMLAVRDALEGNRSFEKESVGDITEPEHSSSDLYTVFRRDKADIRSFDIPVQPADTVSKPAYVASSSEAVKLPVQDEVLVRDSAASAQAVETTDVNGLLHYSFNKEEKAPAERSEPISFGLEPYSVVGTAFDTYIIVEQGDALFLIDQHAAHERILYEKLIRSELRFDSQILLTSKVLTLSPTDHACLMNNIERFRELGFELDEFGPYSVSIHSVPAGIKRDSIEKLISEMIEILRDKGTVSELDILRGALIQSSCKHAIKAGNYLDSNGISNLLSHFSDGSTPLTCPHGRPVMIRVTKREMEKLFKRIQ